MASKNSRTIRPHRHDWKDLLEYWTSEHNPDEPASLISAIEMAQKLTIAHTFNAKVPEEILDSLQDPDVWQNSKFWAALSQAKQIFEVFENTKSAAAVHVPEDFINSHKGKPEEPRIADERKAQFMQTDTPDWEHLVEKDKKTNFSMESKANISLAAEAIEAAYLALLHHTEIREFPEDRYLSIHNQSRMAVRLLAARDFLLSKARGRGRPISADKRAQRRFVAAGVKAIQRILECTEATAIKEASKLVERVEVKKTLKDNSNLAQIHTARESTLQEWIADMESYNPYLVEYLLFSVNELPRSSKVAAIIDNAIKKITELNPE